MRCGSRLFVVDAGTGIAALGATLGTSLPAEIDILFSHFHLDHIGGLPFFKPAVLCNTVIRTHCGHLDGASAAETLDRLFALPIFPIRSTSSCPGSSITASRPARPSPSRTAPRSARTP